MRLWSLLIIAPLFTLPAPPQDRTANPAPKDSAPAGDVSSGKKAFVDIGCFQCHGFVAQGGVGPRLAPKPMSFANFSKYVRQPSGEMPPYTTKILSDQQLANIYAFLRSVPDPPPVDTIPLLK